MGLRASHGLRPVGRPQTAICVECLHAGDMAFCDLEAEAGLFDGSKGEPQFVCAVVPSAAGVMLLLHLIHERTMARWLALGSGSSPEHVLCCISSSVTDA
jgi:hypothetical protein